MTEPTGTTVSEELIEESVGRWASERGADWIAERLDLLEIDQRKLLAAVAEVTTTSTVMAIAKEFHDVFVSADSRGIDLYSPWLGDVADLPREISIRTIDFSSLLEGILDDIGDSASDGVFDPDNEDIDAEDRRANFRELRSFATSILKALDEASTPQREEHEAEKL